MANNILKNLWVTYVDRSYQQIKDRVLTDLHSKTPEITDHTETNIFVKLLDVWSGIAEMIGYYTDNMARELNIGTCLLYKSGVKIAEMFDYSVRPFAPAYVDITFVLPNVSAQNVIIPQGTEIKGEYSFFTTEELIIPIGSIEGTVGSVQATLVQNINLGKSDGTINQKFIIPDAQVAYNSVSSIIATELWTSQYTLAYSKPDDTHLIVSVNEDKEIYIKFGDGVKGAIPENGADIIVDYKVTEGANGNTVIANTVVEIVSTISLPVDVASITCYNDKNAAGGSDIESLDELKANIPKSLRTLNRAVTDMDFKDVAELATGVLKAAILFECGKPVYTFIMPLGGGTPSQSLLDSVDTWFLDKKIINVNTQAEPAGYMYLDINASVTALAGYQRTTVQNDITTALNELYTWGSKDIKDTLYLSNIYQTIEAVDGVANSRISSIIIRPFARALGTADELTWNCVVTENSIEAEYIIEFTGISQFIIYQNNVFMGTFTVNNQVVLDNVIFTITENYNIGDKWQFYSYKNFVTEGMLVMQEYSAPLTGNLSIEITGGI